LYFIRLDAVGVPELAGQPYCTYCSKLALDVGIAEFVLWRPEGVTVYDTIEYNDLSYQWTGITEADPIDESVGRTEVSSSP
jgi:hypothetical protein